MQKPNLEVKGIVSFRGMEGQGFNATLFVDGVKTAFVIDEANGGDYIYEVANKQKFELLKEYIKTLPKWKSEELHMELDTDMDMVIGDLVEEQEARSKLARQMTKKILVGQPLGEKIPDGYEYRTFSFKIPLKQIQTDHLQKQVDIIRATLKDGEGILNTNLEKLGIKV